MTPDAVAIGAFTGGGVAVGLAAGMALALLATRGRAHAHAESIVSAAPDPPIRDTLTPEPPVVAVAVPAGDRPPAAAARLIDIRDYVVPDDDPAAPADAPDKRWLYERLGTALAELGIETLDATGAPDWKLQEAVGTRPTSDAARANTIAATVRPGYRYGATVLRPQQVIVYVAQP